MISTECVTDLDKRSQMIIPKSILTTLKLSVVFGGSLESSDNWLEPKTEPPSGNLSCPNP